MLAKAGAATVHSWAFINGALACVPDAKCDALIKQLEAGPRVRYAEPNYIVHAGVVPNDPSFGHGTHVSGTIGAVGNNGVGVSGVNWNVKVMALKFLDSGGSGTTADALTALDYARLMAPT